MEERPGIRVVAETPHDGPVSHRAATSRRAQAGVHRLLELSVGGPKAHQGLRLVGRVLLDIAAFKSAPQVLRSGKQRLYGALLDDQLSHDAEAARWAGFSGAWCTRGFPVTTGWQRPSVAGA